MKIFLSKRDLHIKIDKINQIGEVYIKFSENIKIPEQIKSSNYSIFNRKNMLKFEYNSEYEGSNLPKLQNWEVKEFSNKEMMIKLNFSNSEQVSKGIG